MRGAGSPGRGLGRRRSTAGRTLALSPTGICRLPRARFRRRLGPERKPAPLPRLVRKFPKARASGKCYDGPLWRGCASSGLESIAMKEKALRRFAVELTDRPWTTLVRLLSDYLTFVGLVTFWLLLLLSKHPLAWLERRLRRPLREPIIGWVARLARG